MKKPLSFLCAFLIFALLLCSASFAEEQELSLASLTELGNVQSGLAEGLTVTGLSYTDGLDSTEGEVSTSSPEVIGRILEALGQIRVTGTTELWVTDWSPSITFTLSDDSVHTIWFNGRSLHAGGQLYELADDGAFWSLTSSLVYAEEDDATPAGAETGLSPNCVDLYFPSNPSTGFSWSFEAEEEGIVAVKEEYFAGSTSLGLTGAGGTHWFHIDGVSEGITSVTFRYARPWESEEPVYTFTYRLSVDPGLNVLIWGVEMA